MATSAGEAGQPNEDFAGAVPGAVLLDGAGIQGTEAICSHGVAWYTHRLGGALLGRPSREDGRDFAAILATTIGEIAADHRGTCDITNPSSPQVTVVMVRALRGRLDYLLLADSFLVLDQVCGDPQSSPTSVRSPPGASALRPWMAFPGQRRSTTASETPASRRCGLAGTCRAATVSPRMIRTRRIGLAGCRRLIAWRTHSGPPGSTSADACRAREEGTGPTVPRATRCLSTTTKTTAASRQRVARRQCWLTLIHCQPRLTGCVSWPA